MDAEKYIVELLLPSGTPFRRTAPMSLAEAEAVKKRYTMARAEFTAAVVPAEKYRQSDAVPMEREDSQGFGYRSKVE